MRLSILGLGYGPRLRVEIDIDPTCATNFLTARQCQQDEAQGGSVGPVRTSQDWKQAPQLVFAQNAISALHRGGWLQVCNVARDMATFGRPFQDRAKRPYRDGG